MRDDRGASVTLSRPPARIVSLAPSLTETLFLLGEGRRLVAVTRFCNFPDRALVLPKIGGVSDPDVEKIVALKPDLVLATTDGNPKERVVALERLGIPVFCVGPQNLKEVFLSIERIGALIGVPEAGKKSAAGLAERAAWVAEKAKKRELRPKALFAVSTRPVIVAGSRTFLDELIRTAGGINAAASYAGRYPRLSTEDLVALKPEIVLIAGMTGVEALPPEVLRWKEVPAFRDGAVVTVDGDLVTRPGPRMVSALEEVARQLDARERSLLAGRPPPRSGRSASPPGPFAAHPWAASLRGRTRSGILPLAPPTAPLPGNRTPSCRCRPPVVEASS